MKGVRVRLIPRDEEFFSMFAGLASRVTSSARLLHTLFSQPDRLAEHVAAIEEI